MVNLGIVGIHLQLILFIAIKKVLSEMYLIGIKLKLSFSVAVILVVRAAILYVLIYSNNLYLNPFQFFDYNGYKRAK